MPGILDELNRVLLLNGLCSAQSLRNCHAAEKKARLINYTNYGPH